MRVSRANRFLFHVISSVMNGICLFSNHVKLSQIIVDAAKCDFLVIELQNEVSNK